MNTFPGFNVLLGDEVSHRSLNSTTSDNLFADHRFLIQSQDEEIQDLSNFYTLLGLNETMSLYLSQIKDFPSIARLDYLLSLSDYGNNFGRIIFRDRLIEGTSKGERHHGGFGNDVIHGKAGNDRINGSFGHDLIDGGEGNDRLRGGFGRDVLIGGAGDDKIFGDFGDDVFFAGAGSDAAFGGFGNDFFLHQLSANLDGETDFYHGGKGKDTLVFLNTFGEFASFQSEIVRFEEFQLEQSSRRRNFFRNPRFTFEFESSSLTVKDIEHVEVILTNEAPSAIDDVFTISEDAQPLVHNFAVNDTDPDHLDGLTVSAIDPNGTQGSVALADGIIAYDPNGQFESLAAGEETTDSFSYTVSDLAGATDTAEVTVTVTGVNDGPEFGEGDLLGGVTAIADNDPGAPPIVLSNSGAIAFTDVDLSDVHTVSVVPQSVGFLGTLVANVTTDSTGTGNGEVTYSFEVNDIELDRLAAGETLGQTYTLTVEDGNGGTASKNVTIQLIGSNDQPLVQAVNAAVGEDDAQVTGLFVVSDVDLSDTHIFSITRAPEHGMVTLNAAGDGFIFNPGNDFQFLKEGEEVVVTFDYTATDSSGTANAISEAGTVSITVRGKNDGPTAVVDAISLTEDSRPVVNNFALNDTDPDHLDALRVSAIDPTGTLGLVSVTDGLVDYDPNGQFESLAAGEETMDSFSYTVSDLAGATDTADVIVTVMGVNDGPEFGEGDLSGGVTEIADNDPGENITVLSDAGVISFTDVDLTDVHTVAVIPQNTGFLGTLVANVTTDSTNSGVGEVTYAFEVNDVALDRLAAGEFLEQIYTLTVEDGNGGTASKNVTIRLTGTNDQPLVQAVNATVGEDEAQVTGLFVVSDVDLSDTHTFSITSAPESGTVTLNAAGDGFIFNPGNDFQFLREGEEVVVTFEYTATDSSGMANAISEVGTVSITIVGNNDAPTAVVDAISLTEDSAPVVNNFASNDTDPDQLDALRVSAIDATGTRGTVSLTDGIVDYNPNGQFESLAAGEETTDSFSYTVSDLLGATDTAEVTVTVTGVNDAPVIDVADSTLSGSVTEIVDGAVGENVTTLSDSGTINFTDLDLSDGHTLSVTPQGERYLGSLTADVSDASTGDGAGQIVWNFQIADSAADSLAAGESLSQRYTITVDDGQGGVDSQEVTLFLTGTNDGPVITPGLSQLTGQVTEAGFADDGSIFAGEPFATGKINAEDADNDAVLTWTIESGAEGIYGAIAINTAGEWAYTLDNNAATTQALNQGETATENFTVRVTDEFGAYTEEIITVTVIGTNDNVYSTWAAFVNSLPGRGIQASSATDLQTLLETTIGDRLLPIKYERQIDGGVLISSDKGIDLAELIAINPTIEDIANTLKIDTVIPSIPTLNVELLGLDSSQPKIRPVIPNIDVSQITTILNNVVGLDASTITDLLPNIVSNLDIKLASDHIEFNYLTDIQINELLNKIPGVNNYLPALGTLPSLNISNPSLKITNPGTSPSFAFSAQKLPVSATINWLTGQITNLLPAEISGNINTLLNQPDLETISLEFGSDRLGVTLDNTFNLAATINNIAQLIGLDAPFNAEDNIPIRTPSFAIINPGSKNPEFEFEAHQLPITQIRDWVENQIQQEIGSNPILSKLTSLLTVAQNIDLEFGNDDIAIAYAGILDITDLLNTLITEIGLPQLPFTDLPVKNPSLSLGNIGKSDFSYSIHADDISVNTLSEWLRTNVFGTITLPAAVESNLNSLLDQAQNLDIELTNDALQFTYDGSVNILAIANDLAAISGLGNQVFGTAPLIISDPSFEITKTGAGFDFNLTIPSLSSTAIIQNLADQLGTPQFITDFLKPFTNIHLTLGTDRIEVGLVEDIDIRALANGLTAELGLSELVTGELRVAAPTLIIEDPGNPFTEVSTRIIDLQKYQFKFDDISTAAISTWVKTNLFTKIDLGSAGSNIKNGFDSLLTLASTINLSLGAKRLELKFEGDFDVIGIANTFGSVLGLGNNLFGTGSLNITDPSLVVNKDSNGYEFNLAIPKLETSGISALVGALGAPSFVSDSINAFGDLKIVLGTDIIELRSLNKTNLKSLINPVATQFGLDNLIDSEINVLGPALTITNPGSSDATYEFEIEQLPIQELSAWLNSKLTGLLPNSVKGELDNILSNGANLDLAISNDGADIKLNGSFDVLAFTNSLTNSLGLGSAFSTSLNITNPKLQVTLEDSEFGFNFVIPRLSKTEITNLAASLNAPELINRFFEGLSDVALTFGTDLIEIKALGEVSLKPLLTLIGSELGLPVGANINDFAVDGLTLRVRDLTSTPVFELESKTLPINDLVSLFTGFAQDAGFTLPPSLNNTLNNFSAQLDNTALLLSTEGVKVTFPETLDFSVGLNDLFGDVELPDFVDVAAKEVSKALTGNEELAFKIENSTFALDKDGVSINTSINGQKLDFSYIGNDLILNYDIGNVLSLENIAKGIDYIEHFKISDVQLTGTNKSRDVNDPSIGLIKQLPGFNLRGNFNFEQVGQDIPGNDPFEFISDKLGVKGVGGFISLGISGFKAGASLGGNIPIIDPSLFGEGIESDFLATLNSVQLEFKATPNPALNLKGILAVSGYDFVQDNEPTLFFTGKLGLTTTDLAGGFALQAKDAQGNDQAWKNPFGIPETEITNLALEIGGSYITPYFTSLAFAGNVKIENYNFDGGFFLNIVDPTEIAMTLTIKDPLRIADLNPAARVSSFLLKQVKEKSPEINLDGIFVTLIDVLDTVLDSNLQSFDSDGDGKIDPLLRFVPFATDVAGVTLPQGYGVNAQVNTNTALTGGNTTGTLSLNAPLDFTSIQGGLSLSSIDLLKLGLIKISGVDDPNTIEDESQELNLDLNLKASNLSQASLSGDAAVTVGTHALSLVDFSIGKSAIRLKGLLDIPTVIKLNLDISAQGASASGSTSLTLFDQYNVNESQLSLDQNGLRVSSKVNLFNFTDTQVDLEIETNGDISFTGSSSTDFLGSTSQTTISGGYVNTKKEGDLNFNTDFDITLGFMRLDGEANAKISATSLVTTADLAGDATIWLNGTELDAVSITFLDGGVNATGKASLFGLNDLNIGLQVKKDGDISFSGSGAANFLGSTSQTTITGDYDNSSKEGDLNFNTDFDITLGFTRLDGDANAKFSATSSAITTADLAGNATIWLHGTELGEASISSTEGGLEAIIQTRLFGLDNVNLELEVEKDGDIIFDGFTDTDIFGSKYITTISGGFDNSNQEGDFNFNTKFDIDLGLADFKGDVSASITSNSSGLSTSNLTGSTEIALLGTKISDLTVDFKDGNFNNVDFAGNIDLGPLDFKAKGEIINSSINSISAEGSLSFLGSSLNNGIRYLKPNESISNGGGTLTANSGEHAIGFSFSNYIDSLILDSTLNLAVLVSDSRLDLTGELVSEIDLNSSIVTPDIVINPTPPIFGIDIYDDTRTLSFPDIPLKFRQDLKSIRIDKFSINRETGFGDVEVTVPEFSHTIDIPLTDLKYTLNIPELKIQDLGIDFNTHHLSDVVNRLGPKISNSLVAAANGFGSNIISHIVTKLGPLGLAKDLLPAIDNFFGNGPISDSVIFLDTNPDGNGFNFQLDPNETFTFTDDYGHFPLDSSSLNFDFNNDGIVDSSEAIVVGGGDISYIQDYDLNLDGKIDELESKLQAGDNGIDTTIGKEVQIPFISTVDGQVTPITTFHTSLLMRGMSAAEAENLVYSSFTSGVSITTPLEEFEVFSEIGQGNTEALQLEIGHIRAHYLMLMASTILKQSQPDLSKSENFDQLLTALTNQLIEDEGIDLTSFEGHQQLIKTLTSDLDAGIVDAIANTIVAGENKLQEIIDSLGLDNLNLITINYIKGILLDELPQLVTDLLDGNIAPSKATAEFEDIFTTNNQLIQYSLNDQRTITLETSYNPGEGILPSETAQFVVNLGENAPEQGLTIFYHLAGTATLGEDYKLVDDSTSRLGELNFAPGETQTTLNLELFDDGIVEENAESITLTLEYAGDGFLIDRNNNSASAVINADDTLSLDASEPDVLKAQHYDISEGSSGQNDLLGSTRSDQLFGLGGNDTLQGREGNDVLDGGSGDDVLIGSAGNDILYGGDGADQFVISPGNNGFDIFKDFDPLQGDKVIFLENSSNQIDLNNVTILNGFVQHEGKNLALLQNENETYAYLKVQDTISVLPESSFS